MTFGINEAVVQVEYIDRSNYLKYKGKRVYVSGSVMLANCGLYELGIDFTYVGGSFICCFNKLTTLKGCPSFVGGTFDCSNNNLNSLQFYPEEINGEFDCYSNPITDVNHIPSYYDKIHHTSMVLEVEIERRRKLKLLEKLNSN